LILIPFHLLVHLDELTDGKLCFNLSSTFFLLIELWPYNLFLLSHYPYRRFRDSEISLSFRYSVKMVYRSIPLYEPQSIPLRVSILIPTFCPLRSLQPHGYFSSFVLPHDSTNCLDSWLVYLRLMIESLRYKL